MASSKSFVTLECHPATIAAQVLETAKRVLLFGQPGIGKSTLAAELARILSEQGSDCLCLGADPGSPAFGVPGSVSLASWGGEEWELIGLEAVCSLDAGRFRLPLVSAIRGVAERVSGGVLLIDSPGVVRGAAGAELLEGVAAATVPDAVLVLVREGKPVPLQEELSSLIAKVFVVRAVPQAQRPGKRTLARDRTALWGAYLRDAEEQELRLDKMQLVGTPPPLDVPEAWPGRQIALLGGGRTLAMGEVRCIEDTAVSVTMRQMREGEPRALLVRDACRDHKGLLSSAKPFSTTVRFVPPPDVLPQAQARHMGGPCPVARVGPATATLVNGIFGDPLLHLRLTNSKRSLLLDLGEAGRLPARIAHQVSDVLISHAHFDHIAGFLWLLRSRIGTFSPCRVYGPPGLAENIFGLISGIHWDRIGDRGPEFMVAELHGETLIRFRIQAGRRAAERLDDRGTAGGLLLAEPDFRLRATVLDHGTPVLAFTFEPHMQINIRKERLLARGLEPGPWLNQLKERIAEDRLDVPVRLPDGSTHTAGSLRDELALITPGQKLAYATDLADTASNRERLVALARGAHTFFCEAPFLEGDTEQAMRTGHLTTRACGEIATAAGVQRLVPFHFSRRYEGEPQRVYAEVRAACSRTVVPPPGQLAPRA